MRGALALVALAAAAALTCAASLIAGALAAPASEQASLRASFTPDRLGVSTTIGFGFHVQTVTGVAPPPMTSVVLRMPAGMNYTLATLGPAIRQPAVLQAKGRGGLRAELSTGLRQCVRGSPVRHRLRPGDPEIQAVSGPPTAGGNMVVLFYANGRTPVAAQLVFEGDVLPDSGAFSSQLATTEPLIPSVPDGPGVSIVDVNATIGPSGLTYYKHVHGHLQPFHPLGIGVPEHCPRGGFPFSASFTFQDGSQASASTTVPCPPRRR